eukprot:6349977-Amphidinium_carterae.1
MHSTVLNITRSSAARLSSWLHARITVMLGEQSVLFLCKFAGISESLRTIEHALASILHRSPYKPHDVGMQVVFEVDSQRGVSQFEDCIQEVQSRIDSWTNVTSSDSATQCVARDEIFAALQVLRAMCDVTPVFTPHGSVSQLVSSRVQDSSEWLGMGKAWSLVVNFAYLGGEQTAKDLDTLRRTSVLHGLWFDVGHNPGPLLLTDLTTLARVDARTLSGSLFPMVRQRLPREFTRHAATFMSADCYVQLIAEYAYHVKAWSSGGSPSYDMFIIYLRCTRAGICHVDGHESRLPMYVLTQLGFGGNWVGKLVSSANIQGIKTVDQQGYVVLVLNPSAVALKFLLTAKNIELPHVWDTDRVPLTTGMAVLIHAKILCTGKVLANSLGMPAIWLHHVPIGSWALKTDVQFHGTVRQSIGDGVNEIKVDVSSLNDADIGALQAKLDNLCDIDPSVSPLDVRRSSAGGSSGPSRLCVDWLNVKVFLSRPTTNGTLRN